jgi:hypothetical protein
LQQADYRWDRTDKRPTNAAVVEPCGSRTAARIGPAFFDTLAPRFRGNRSLRTTSTTRNIRAEITISRQDELTGYRRCGRVPNRRSRFLYLEAANRRTRTFRWHRPTRRRCTDRHQHRTHERCQRDPGGTQLSVGNRHVCFPEQPAIRTNINSGTLS